MKHIIFSILIMITVLHYSCIIPDTRFTDHHYIVNLTDKEIVHVLYIDDSMIQYDSLSFHISGKCDTTLEWTLSALTGWEPDDYRLIGYKDFWVYNITDTTSLHWKVFERGYEYNSESIPEIFNIVESDIKERDWKENVMNRSIDFYLSVNNRLLSLMHKDTTMLQRFKDYYHK